ncbi:Tetratricopeptide repeat-containing protein [Chryseobacterium ureilyticum]|uniref:histidine kinase n=1 Tax=Chryseobacterium ureilyticum TaxID=373668 RepID=A0A1N7MWT4_9FLAO|nr:tetratricopeptide repeat-containing sensor histidine kinase [Chryseobacterium ureilyticum]SIS90585.1 Tetratricopeptide repeat-containing protein [Chryseobacterium ureilyticum]
MRIFLVLLVIILSSCSKTKTITNQQENVFYDKAFEFLEKNNEDSAYIYFDKAKDLFQQNKDLVQEGKCLINMAIISTNKGDYFSGQTISLEAVKYFNEKDKEQYQTICSNYNNLGIATTNLKDYNSAIKFYDLAIKFANNNINRVSYLNNKAHIYTEQKKYKDAIDIYNIILPQTQHKDYKIFARLLSNLAFIKWMNNPRYNAEPELLNALKINKSINDLWGQNASHSHLADYYAKTDEEKSLFHAKEMYKIATGLNSPDDRIESLQKLIQTDPNNYSKYFSQFLSLNDSLQTTRNNAKNQFALIRFDAEKLKTENIQKENQILLQNIGIASLVVLLIGGTISGSIWIKRRKERLQKENELKIKENELKISKKVHDVVANGIYQVMTKIENQEHFDKDKALDELEFVYEKSRDISYEKVDSNDILEFYKKISNLIGSFKNEKVNTFLAGNGANIWMDLSHSVQDEVYQIMRELLVNMKKHSRANLVAFKFERNNNLIQIQYTDNGIGIPGEIIHGNGLTNTVSRIEKIKGSIIFDNTIEKGLKVYISFPIS